MLRLIVFAILIVFAQSFNPCDDWVQYRDTKCMKVLESKVTQEEAVKECLAQNQMSKLLVIHSNDEETFAKNLALKYRNVSANAWIGLRFDTKQKKYIWSDGSALDFTTWSDDAVKDGTLECVQMILEGDTAGKWMDDSCQKKAIAICQRDQVIDNTVLRKAIENNENNIEIIKNNIENNLIPVGFIYTQLPDQKQPTDIWPQFTWSDVTKKYAGLFFRAEGGGSAKFGEQQSDDAPRLTSITETECTGTICWEYAAPNGKTAQMPINKGEMSKRMFTGSWNENDYHFSLSFQISGSEVRPINKAIRIWERVA